MCRNSWPVRRRDRYNRHILPLVDRDSRNGSRPSQRGHKRGPSLGFQKSSVFQPPLRFFEVFELFLAESEMVGEFVNDSGPDIAQKSAPCAADLLHRPAKDLDDVRMSFAVRLRRQRDADEQSQQEASGIETTPFFQHRQIVLGRFFLDVDNHIFEILMKRFRERRHRM